MPSRTISSTTVVHHVDFLSHLAAQAVLNQLVKRPAPLSVEQHAAHRRKMENVVYIKPKYAAETEINIGGIFGKWKRFCTKMKVGDWELTLQNIKRSTMQDFFFWVLENHKIGSEGTSKEYIRQFQQLYTTITSRFADRNDIAELYKYHDNFLAPRFSLRKPNIDDKPVLNIASLWVILTFNIAYDKGIFPLELQRVNLSGCYMILCYTGARPAELVNNERRRPKDGSVEELFGAKAIMSAEAEDEGMSDDEEATDESSRELAALLYQETVRRERLKALCYEDILNMLVRYPVTRRVVPAMSIKFIYHKGSDNKPKPTIFFTLAKKLIFCPILLFLSIALFDHAFDAECLKDAASVLGAEVAGGRECLPLRWKSCKLKVPFFRRILRDGTMSEDEATLYSTLRDHMARQSLEAGFEKAWTPKAGQRGAANAANGNAPDAVRDQMMRHNPKFYTFQDAYLNQIANFDLQNAFLEEETEDQLFRLFAHVGLTRDPRAIRDMVPAEVWEELQPDPEITTLKEQRTALRQGKYRYQGLEVESQIRELTDKIRCKEARYEERIVREYRKYYFYNSPTWELERQARGEQTDEYAEPAIDLVIPERARLAEILRHQPKDLTDEQLYQRRIEVLDLYVALCGKKETVKGKRKTPAGVPTTGFAKVEAGIEAGSEPVPDPFPLLMDKNQCSECLGDERLTLGERTFRYCRPTKRNDPFDDQHLEAKERAEQLGQLVVCKYAKCKDVKLRTVDQFRNHVESVYAIKLRSSDLVQQRRSRKLRSRRSRQSG